MQANINTKLLPEFDSTLLSKLKEELSLQVECTNIELPEDKIVVGIHIRKGNGGGEFYDGELSSTQIFNTNIQPAYVTYTEPAFVWLDHISHKRNTPLNPNVNVNAIDSVPLWDTKFPPEQFYIDQVRYLLQYISPSQLHIQIFTDYNQPLELVQRIKEELLPNNISIGYQTWDDSYTTEQKIANDLHNLARTQILIRSQSYFARVAELLGKHQLVICPFKTRWEGGKLVTTVVGVKGQLP